MESRPVRPAIVILAGALLILAAWATFVWVWSATAIEPWIPIAVWLAVPTFAAFAGVRAGMRSAHVLTWAVPSSLLILLAFFGAAIGVLVLEPGALGEIASGVDAILGITATSGDIAGQ